MEDQTVVTKRSRNESETESSIATDEDDLTSENNKRVRKQARKIFVDLKKKGDKGRERSVSVWRKEKINKPHSAKKSGKPQKSRTRQSSGE